MNNNVNEVEVIKIKRKKRYFGVYIDYMEVYLDRID